jgi:spermidine synthase
MSPTALPAAFFLSGAAGLIFQIVWLYRCGLVFGSSVAAVTVVLSSFMAGLAAGNAGAARFGRRVSSPLAAYALLEVVVAVTGMIVTLLLPHAGAVLVPVARRLGESGAAIDAVRFALAFAVLVVPATAMGATLPLLVSAMCAAGDPFGSALGRLYGWNTLGAVAGAVASEVVLIGTVGVSATGGCAALCNLCAAGLALVVAKRGAATMSRSESAGQTQKGAVWRGDATAGRRSAQPAPVWPLLFAAAVCGASLLALEVVWFRFLSMYVLVTTLAMSLMLAVVLSGIGAGSLVAATWLRRSRRSLFAVPLVSCLAGYAVVLSYAAFQFVTSGTQVGEWWRILWFTSVLSLPVSCLSGALFTLLADALDGRLPHASASAGWLACANTVGALCGPPAAAYLLLPHIGTQASLFAVACAYGVVAILAALTIAPLPDSGARRRVTNMPSLLAGAGLLIALVLFPFGAMERRYVTRAASAYADDGSIVVATREGPSETLFVMQQQWLGKPVYSRLITNGFSMSGTALQGQRYMRAFAYYPMLLHDGPLKHALVVCYGVGVTVGAVTHIPAVETIDVAEISRDVVAMSDVIYPAGSRPLEDPRVRLHIEDGRFFLETTTERFDLITGEPPPPRTPGTVNIYTREYFQLIHDHLAEGGIASYWLPVARPHPGTDVNTIARAFCDVFSDCSAWNATPFDLMLIGSRGATGPRRPDQFTAPWQTPGLEARLREVGFERAEQIGATFVGDADWLRQLTATAPPLTDDFPQRLRPVPGRPSLSDPGYGGDPAVTRMYQDAVSPERARTAFAASPLVRRLWPAALIDRTLPYFAQQAAVNRVYWEGARPMARIEDLDAVLTGTTLRTLPLWMLGSDDVKQRIAETSTDTSGAREYARALRALSGRDYTAAVQWLGGAESHGLTGPTIAPLRAYALFKLGQLDVVLLVLAMARPTNDDERHFWEWLHMRAE